MKNFFNRLKSYSDRPWFLPFVCFLAFVDLFILVIPTEGMIVTTSILKPKRWWLTALTVTTASSLGALVMGMIAKSQGEPFVVWIMGEKFLESANWIRMSGWIEHYGFWGLWFIALGPLPQQPAILFCALTHMPLSEIFWAVYLGRAPKYFLFSYLATHSPKLFRKYFGSFIDGVELPEENALAPTKDTPPPTP